MSDADAPLIRLRGITKTYGRGQAAFQGPQGVDLDIEAGEFVAIMGPSGSGKSTAMNTLGCLDVPTSGDYLFRGIAGAEAHARPARAAAPQVPGLRVPGLQPAGAHQRAGERRAAAALPRRAGRRRATRRRAALAAVGPGGLGAPHAGRTLRRPAAAWRSRARWSPTPRCCSPTSPPATSIRSAAARSWSC